MQKCVVLFNFLVYAFINDVNKQWEKFLDDIKPLEQAKKKKWFFFLGKGEV